MAEAFLNLIGNGKVTGLSAGTQPAEKINPAAVQVMSEIGIDISGNKPRQLTVELMNEADRAVVMGCGAEKSCPASFIQVENWELEDPEGQPLEKVRAIRDEIRDRVNKLVNTL